MKNFILYFVICGLVITTATFTQVPNKISYQGLLTTSSGTPVQDGSYDLRFGIYDVSSGGVPLYVEDHSSVTVSNGTFNVVLGSFSTINLLFDNQYYIEVTALAGPGISSSVTFSPRSMLTTVPYAFRAKYVSSGGNAGWTDDGAVVRLNTNTDSVGIGTASPTKKLQVDGSVKITDTVFARSIYLKSNGFANIVCENTEWEVINTIENRSGNNRTSIHTIPQVSLSLEPLYSPRSSVIETPGTNGLSLATLNNAPINFYTNPYDQRMIITGSGNVGIGTIGPTAKLDVWGSMAVKDTTFTEYISSRGSLELQTLRITRMFINYINGNVGIGTSNPTAKLEVNGQVKISGGSPGLGKVLTSDESGLASWQTLSNGTVTSVGLLMPIQFAVSGSPVTTSGTLSANWVNQNANTVFCGPSAGGSGTPTFRALVSNDIPNLDATKITTGVLPISRGGTNSSASLTNNRLMMSSSGAIIEAAPLSNGQLFIGSMGAAPVAANLTAGTGISITNGAGSITISNTGYLQGGNSFGSLATLGTNDNYALGLKTNNIERMRIDVTGNVGIGTTSPLHRLQVAGDINIEAGSGVRINNAAPAGYYLRGDGTRFVASSIQLSDLPTISSAAGWTDDGSIVRLTSSTDNVGIGTSAPTSKLHVAGNITAESYTKLGLDAPAIKMKKLTGTTAATEGGTATIFHGLTASKIISINVMVEYSTGQYLHPGFTNSSEKEFNWASTSTSIEVYNSATNSGSILSKPIKILIVYEE